MADENVKIGIGFEALPEGVEGLRHAKEHAKELGESLSKVKEEARHFSDEMKGIISTIAAGAGIGFGLDGMYKLFVESNMELEKMNKQLGATIAGTYQFGALGVFDNFKQSIRVAREEMEKFGAASLKTGVSKEHYGEAFKILLPAMSQAHKSIAETATLTMNIAALARASGMDPDTAAQSVAMAAQTGHVSKRNQFIRLLGISPKKGESHADLLADIQGAIGKFPIEQMTQVRTLSDTIDIIKNEVSEIAETAGKPMFVAVSDEAAKLLKYIQENRGEVETIAKQVAGALTSGLKDVVGIVTTLADHADAVKDASEAILVVWAGGKLLSGVQAVYGTMKKMAELNIAQKFLGRFGMGAGAAEGAAAGAVAEGGAAAAGGWAGYGAAATGATVTGILGTLLGVVIDIYGVVDAGSDSSQRAWGKGTEYTAHFGRIGRDASAQELVGDYLHSKLGADFTVAAAKQILTAGSEQHVLDAIVSPIKGKGLGINLTTADVVSYLSNMKEVSADVAGTTKGVDPPKTNITVHNNWNFDKNHDADEIAFSVNDIFTKLAANPRHPKNAFSALQGTTEGG